nr:30S ribosomal protein S6 [Eubacterium sp.]
AYEIEKMKEAYYYFITIETDNTDMTRELESRLRIMDDVMRFLCVSIEA